MKETIKLFVASVSGDLQVYNLDSHLQILRSLEGKNVLHMEMSTSLPTYTFNKAWAVALNARDAGEVTHFLMIHADVRPRGEKWLDVLLEEMTRTKADILSVIIPIKDHRGLTSTALDTDPWLPMRLTSHQVINEFPETWSAPNLLFNSGLILVDFTKPWVEQVCFTMRDTIVRSPETGQWEVYCESEDWNFARQCNKLGLRSFVTRKVVVDHFGTGHWSSDIVWGQKYDNQVLERLFKQEGLTQTDLKFEIEDCSIERPAEVAGSVTG